MNKVVRPSTTFDSYKDRYWTIRMERRDGIRHRLTVNGHRAARDTSFRTWREVAGVAFGA